MTQIDETAQNAIETFVVDLTKFLDTAGPEATKRAQIMLDAASPTHMFDLMFAINILVHDIRNKSSMPDDQFVFAMQYISAYVGENARVNKGMCQ